MAKLLGACQNVCCRISDGVLQHGKYPRIAPRFRVDSQDFQRRIRQVGKGEVLLAARACKAIPQRQSSSGLDPHRARIGAAQLRRQEGDARARGAARELEAQGRAQGRDSFCRGARRAAGLHRRTAAGRSGRHAHHRQCPRQEAQDHRAAGARRSGGRPLHHGRLLRKQGRARPEHEARVPAQQRALPVHEVGHAGVRHVWRRATGLRYRSPGESGISGARCLQDQEGRVLP